ncbi:MAG TPA: hypothetical protein VLA31_02995 [Burkholderiaceae bacterium]|nr:hypothetical protein [Burkholderiaceae bacterium]
MSNGTPPPAIDPSQSTLSPNFAPFVYGMLGKGWEAANMPFMPFMGQRFAYGEMDPTTGMYSAGQSPLESQAFKGLGAMGTYDPTKFNTGLGPLGSVQDYMNPYLSGVSDIEAREARREADIGRQSEQARLAQAGAYGGSRQAIMESERQRNLNTQIGDIRSKGLQAAFDRAQKQRLDEANLGLEGQRLGEASRQFGAQQDLRVLADQLAGGREERRIAQEPLDFGYQQFQESMKYPRDQATYMSSLLQGLPLRATGYSPATEGQSAATAAIGGGLGAYGMMDYFSNLGRQKS